MMAAVKAVGCSMLGVGCCQARVQGFKARRATFGEFFQRTDRELQNSASYKNALDLAQVGFLVSRLTIMLIPKLFLLADLKRPFLQVPIN
jgi:hypothetical protein